MCLRRNEGNYGAVGAESRGTVEKAAAEYQQILRIKWFDLRRNPIPVDLDAGTQTAKVTFH
jgi:hypothetical protein